MQIYFEAIEFDPVRAAKQNLQDIYLSLEVDKLSSKLNIKRKRILIITNETLSLFRMNRCNQQMILKRRTVLRRIRALTMNLGNQDEFIVHFETAHDLRLCSNM
jgi:hypothetical protein